jgi:hypothetical protein
MTDDAALDERRRVDAAQQMSNPPNPGASGLGASKPTVVDGQVARGARP